MLYLYLAIVLVLVILKLFGARFSWWWVALPILAPAFFLFVGLLAMVALGNL